MSNADNLRRLMATEGSNVKASTSRFNQQRYNAVSDLPDYQHLKADARAIKEDAIERLPSLIAELRETVEANGGSVYIADDADDATKHVQDLVSREDGDKVVKSKSMTSEEIDLNEKLEEVDIDVVETDLGEWVLQLADEAPSHLVTPAIHKSQADIAKLLNHLYAPDEPLETAEELTQFARDELAKRIREADVGITGANFITADTGTILLVTSEGNARRVVASTDVHIAIAGVEKIVPSIADLQPFVELIGRSATGQDITSYISLLTGPGDTPVVDFSDDTTPLSELATDRQFHLVLIDNGRMTMRDDDDLRETLYCIRCSACANSCANFQSVGGHAFGGETYTGGIATGWEAGVEGLDIAAEFNDLCTGCSRCVNACPVQIDIPWINTVVRERINKGEHQHLGWLVDGLTPDEEGEGVPLDKRVFGNFETVAKFGSLFAPLSNWVVGTRFSQVFLAKTVGIDPRRELPTFHRETFVDWADDHGTRMPDAPRRVVLYPDLYTNHVFVERGKATVRMLHALDVDVIVPDVIESGRAPLSQGMISTARKQAESVEASLRPYVNDGEDIVVIEPSDLAMFQREYNRLLPPERFEMIQANTYDVMAYVLGLLTAGADQSNLCDGDGERLAYHSHCQQRTLGLDKPTIAALERVGYDVATSDVECCGMAGSFGYKSDYYELSMDVGKTLKEQFQSSHMADRTVVASGTSCQDQLDAMLGRPVFHPAEMVAPSK